MNLTRFFFFIIFIKNNLEPTRYNDQIIISYCILKLRDEKKRWFLTYAKDDVEEDGTSSPVWQPKINYEANSDFRLWSSIKIGKIRAQSQMKKK